ncbi:XdhC family protein [Yinghuangia soli]|uniref:XdhC family protein n=1 Tax=Yinghuangia soli TaxID=2908204 RepID=A0AA41Q5W2_9ACTN|nr:XdhC/CoxI family protein [Yinghuangia soli]MCF2531817.1 XdhC family protein [Yinghuangia soli]
MFDIVPELNAWRAEGKAFALATVVDVSGSAPRLPGAALAVSADGEAVGSISGGCVEGAVYELCREALETGTPVLQRFGYSDEDAFAVGLTCGGVIDVFVHPEPAVDAALRPIADRAPVAVARVVAGPAHRLGATLVLTAAAAAPSAAVQDGEGAGPGSSPDGASAGGPDGTSDGAAESGPVSGSLGGTPLFEAAVRAEVAAMLDTGRGGLVTYGPDGRLCAVGPDTATVFVEAYTPPPRMIVFGAIDFAAAVVRIGKFLGYQVTVCDAREVFATPRRFPDADEVVVDWPHRYLDSIEVDGRTVLCVLTHDAKFDIPLLERALRLPVAYVGAMGSRSSHETRLQKLRDLGLTEAELARLHSPIGLDLGARTPEETAIAVGAEIVAHRRGGTGRPLSATEGPIHHDGMGSIRPYAAPAAPSGHHAA